MHTDALVAFWRFRVRVSLSILAAVISRASQSEYGGPSQRFRCTRFPIKSKWRIGSGRGRGQIQRVGAGRGPARKRFTASKRSIPATHLFFRRQKWKELGQAIIFPPPKLAYKLFYQKLEGLEYLLAARAIVARAAMTAIISGAKDLVYRNRGRFFFFHEMTAARLIIETA